MRTYRLAHPDYRKIIDLRDYKVLIEATIIGICPGAQLQVNQDNFVILTPITKGEAIKIGRALAHSILGQFCLSRPILFVGR